MSGKGSPRQLNISTAAHPPLHRVTRVLLVDDSYLVRMCVRAVLAKNGIDVVAEAGTIAEAIAEADRLLPDVVLLEVRLPDGSGVDACREIRAACPQTRILFLSAHEDEAAMLATVFAVADGYVLKEISGDHLVQSIRTVASGLSVIDPNAMRPMLERLRRSWSAKPAGSAQALSGQEQRVLELVAEGKTNKEIAAAMGLSPKTVKNYLSRLFRKLKVTRRSEAAARSIRDQFTLVVGPIGPTTSD